MAIKASLSRKPKKPKKPPIATAGTKIAQQTSAGIANGTIKPRNTKLPQATPVAAVAPKAPSAAPVAAARPSIKPPPSTQGEGIRSRAESTYSAALRLGRQGIVQAALRLGSPEIINALKADPNFAEYVAALDKGANDPTSMFAQAAHDEDQGLTDIDRSSNARNTYFSSRRVEDRGNLTNDFRNARAGYLADYQTNYNTLMGNIGAAEGQHSQDLADADAADLNAWLALNPEPTGPDPTATDTPATTPATPLPTIPGMTPTQVQQAIDFYSNPNWGKDMYGSNPNAPKPGYDFVQQDGSRKGLSYKVVLENGKKYRFYENGDKVLVR